MHFHLPTLDHINGGKASKSPHDRLYRNGSQSARQITRGVHTQDGKTYSSKSNSSFNISSSNSPKFGKVNSSKKRSDKGGRKNANGGAGGVRKRNKIKASLENNSSEAVLAEDILSSLGHSTLR